MSVGRRKLGVAVDLENLREGVKPVIGLLRALEADDAVVHLVGGPWAQATLADRAVPGSWPVRRHVNADHPEAADDVIHGLLDQWRHDGRVAVVASSDGGFAISLAALRHAGVPAFLVTTGKPAKRLKGSARVFVLDSTAGIDAAAEAIEASR